eukprot:jgi/Hompol1/2226/HPOL_005919-RA
MPVSLHSHSGQFCLHAVGNLEDIVLKAIELGYEVYGLTEHMPRTRNQDLYPEEAHLQASDTVSTFDQFIAHARHLQQKYSSKIKLLVGMETENIHSQTLSEINSICQRLRPDYLVGSVHHIRELPLDFDEEGFARIEALFSIEATGSADESRTIGTELAFQSYFDSQYELLRTIKPMVVGHFDLVRIFRPDFPLSEAVWKRIERNVAEIVEQGAIVEINSQGWRKRLPNAYPQQSILQKFMKGKGVRFGLSDDSHGPDAVGMNYELLHGYLTANGIDEIWFPEVDPVSGGVRITSRSPILSLPFWNSFLNQ